MEPISTTAIYSLLTYYYGNDIEQNATFTLNIIYPILLHIIIY